MATLLTPGVYLRQIPVRRLPEVVRTDVAGFVGLAERGPLDTPQRLLTFRDFQSVFGGFLPYANLAYTVRAFFENGGDTCWVVRVAGSDVQTARATLDVPLTRTMVHRAVVAARGPGSYGNFLSVRALPISTLTATNPPIEVATLVVTENGQPIEWLHGRTSTVRSAGEGRTTTLRSAGQELIDTVNRESRLIWFPDPVATTSTTLDPIDQAFLSGGRDGLRHLSIADFTGDGSDGSRGLATLEPIDEIAIVAIPDLVAPPFVDPPPSRVVLRQAPDPCAIGGANSPLDLSGVVVDAETKMKLAAASVGANGIVTGNDRICETTDAAGAFTLVGIPRGTIDLSVCLSGYERLTIPLNTTAIPGATYALTETLELVPVEGRPVFSYDEIARGQDALIAHCETLRDRFALLDPPRGSDPAPSTSTDQRADPAPTTKPDPCDELCKPCQTESSDSTPIRANGQLDTAVLLDWRNRFSTRFAALYYPWLRLADPLRPDDPTGRLVPPSGHVAGIFAATDRAEGVFRPPANRELAWIADVAVAIDDVGHGVLNPAGINAIRAFPGRGIRVYGARTLANPATDSAWLYVNVRRLMSALEEMIEENLQWAVFEPNDITLRFSLRSSLTTLLDRLWRQGAFAGETPDAAYTVRCDETTTPPEDEILGRVIAEVHVAPVVPYEFIVLRVGVAADELRVTEG